MANSPAPTITLERLEEIRALLEKATPPPLDQGWITDGDGNKWPGEAYIGSGDDDWTALNIEVKGPRADETAAMIVAAVNALPALLALASRALEAEQELEIWKSVFPDIAPDQVLPNRSLLEARLVAAEATASALREALTDARENGLIYWEPQTARGRIAKAAMLDRIDAALSAPGTAEE